MKRVIVTGGTGFIGRALVAEIARRYPQAEVIPVGSAVVDIADEHAWFAWLEQLGGEVDHIVHLAALYKAGDWPVHHPATQFNVNSRSMSTRSKAGSGSSPPRSSPRSCRTACIPASPTPTPKASCGGTSPRTTCSPMR